MFFEGCLVKVYVVGRTEPLRGVYERIEGGWLTLRASKSTRAMVDSGNPEPTLVEVATGNIIAQINLSHVVSIEPDDTAQRLADD